MRWDVSVQMKVLCAFFGGLQSVHNGQVQMGNTQTEKKRETQRLQMQVTKYFTIIVRVDSYVCMWPSLMPKYLMYGLCFPYCFQWAEWLLKQKNEKCEMHTQTNEECAQENVQMQNFSSANKLPCMLWQTNMHEREQNVRDEIARIECEQKRCG